MSIEELSREMDEKERMVSDLKKKIEAKIATIESIKNQYEEESEGKPGYEKEMLARNKEDTIDIALRVLQSDVDKYLETLVGFQKVYFNYIKLYIKKRGKEKISSDDERRIATMQLSKVFGIKSFIDGALKRIDENIEFAKKTIGEDKMKEYSKKFNKLREKYVKLQEKFKNKVEDSVEGLIQLGYSKENAYSFIGVTSD
ncbi:hypothetical protein GF352_04205 [archaeon]|nr:hypothetical protein [archaeon]